MECLESRALLSSLGQVTQPLSTPAAPTPQLPDTIQQAMSVAGAASQGSSAPGVGSAAAVSTLMATPAIISMDQPAVSVPIDAHRNARARKGLISPLWACRWYDPRIDQRIDWSRARSPRFDRE